MTDFNPKSTDAMFATILQRLDDIANDRKADRVAVVAVEQRVTALEREKWYQRGIAAGAGAVVMGAIKVFSKW